MYIQISEVGIIINGLSAVFTQYDDKKNKLTNPDLRNSLLDAILKMGTAVWMGEEIQHFNFKKYKLILKQKKLIPTVNVNKAPAFETDIIFYAIADKEIKIDLVNNILTQINDEFLKQHSSIADKNTGNVAIFRPFKKVIDEILADLRFTPDKRFGTIF